MPSEIRIHCEGYHDQTFWTECLFALNCKDLSDNGKKSVSDPWGDPVRSGQYGLESSSGKFIRIVPVNGGRQKLRNSLKFPIQYHRQKSLEKLVVSTDSDSVKAEGNKLNPDERLTIETLEHGTLIKVATKGRLKPYGVMKKLRKI